MSTALIRLTYLDSTAEVLRTWIEVKGVKYFQNRLYGIWNYLLFQHAIFQIFGSTRKEQWYFRIASLAWGSLQSSMLSWRQKLTSQLTCTCTRDKHRSQPIWPTKNAYMEIHLKSTNMLSKVSVSVHKSVDRPIKLLVSLFVCPNIWFYFELIVRVPCVSIIFIRTASVVQC